MVKAKALSLSRQWVHGEVKQCGNVTLIVNWKEKDIQQIFPNTICYELGHRIKSKTPIYENDIFIKGSIHYSLVDIVKKDKKRGIKEPYVLVRATSYYGKLKKLSLEEFAELEHTGRNTLNKSALKYEKFDGETINRLYDKGMAREIRKTFVHGGRAEDVSIDGGNTFSYNIIPAEVNKDKRLIMFSDYGCLDMSKHILIPFLKEVCEIVSVYFGENSFNFDMFERGNDCVGIEKYIK